MPRKGYVWVYTPEKIKFTAAEKAVILKKVEDFISASVKLKEKVKRFVIRGNHLHMYEYVEVFRPEDAVFIKPLIDDKYIEYPYARITFKDKNAEKCTADWQRANEQWIEMFSGTLAE